MVYVYGRKRKSTAGMARDYKRPRRVMPTRVVRTQAASAKIVKTALLEHWQFSTAAVSGFWRYLSTAASDLAEWTEFANVFDEYRITNVKFSFRPKYDTFPVSTGYDAATSAYVAPFIHTIVDQASTKIPTGSYNFATENVMLENGTVRTYDGTKAFSVSYKPKVFNGLLAGGTAATAEWAPWIRTSEPAVRHNGLHVFIKLPNFASLAVGYDIYSTVTVEFRGAR